MKQYKKTILLLVSAVLVLTAAVGTTFAYLIAGAGPGTNTFTPTEITTNVDEDIKTDPDVKNNVKIQNTGDTEAYIRAAVIVTWQDKQGNVYGQKPVEDVDYNIKWWNEDNDTSNDDAWFKESDGFYYHKAPVKSDDEDPDNCYTNVLFTECKLAEGAEVPDGYFLNVEVLGSGIQSKPETVVSEAWPTVKVDNGKLVVKED